MDELVKQLREVEEMLKVAQFKEAANLIEQTVNALDELTRENESLAKSVNEASEILRRRWIPVTERLPRMWEEVILRFPNNQAVGFHDGDSGWAVFSGDNMYTYVAPEEVHPTHWKPKEE